VVAALHWWWLCNSGGCSGVVCSKSGADLYVGKSAIARKLVTRLKSLGRFRLFFFFQHKLVGVQTSVNLWHTFAFDLLREYPSVMDAIVTKLKDSEIDLENTNAGELFWSLVEEPLKHSTDIPSG
jgi:hypothetical protein